MAALAKKQVQYFIMNQHSIQKAYLKNFESNGRIWVFNKKTGNCVAKPADQCSSENDFQSEILEELQNREIESPGIKKLRGMAFDHVLTEDDITKIMYWTALHLIRNKKFRKESDSNHELDFRELYQTEKLFSGYYRNIFTHTCDDSKFFITSDSPIIEFIVGQHMLRVLVWSPTKAFLFSPIDDFPVHQEVEVTEMINSMIYSSSYEELYSNYNQLPLEKYKDNIRKWNLIPNLEKTEFTVKNT